MTLTAARDDNALVDPGDPVKLAIEERLEPFGVGGHLHDTEGYRTIPAGVKVELPGAEPDPDPAGVVVRTSPVAERVRAFVAAAQKAEPAAKWSLSKLSRSAGLGRTQLTMILRRLDEGADIGADTLERVAVAMGHTLHWLRTGEEPATGVRLGSLERFAEVVAELRATYPKLSDQSIAHLADVILPHAPKTLTVAKLLPFAVGLDVFLGES